MLSDNPITADFAASILVVDDDADMRELIVRRLSDAGYGCVEAGCAAEAWTCLGQVPVALVTLDISLPGQSGIELLPEIKAAFPGTEVLMITGEEQTLSVITALNLGASGYLIKPVVADELIFHVKKALERRQLLIENRLYMQRLEDRVAEQTREIRWAHEETIHRLVTAASCRDEETGAHIRRTGLLSELLALAAGWSQSEADQLRMAAPMHDVGKIGIPDAILQKPGMLSQKEFERMKQHTTIGAQMLAGSTSPILQLAEQIALCHHERWDGTGYPQGLAGEAIPEAARIVSIVDVYDALSHDRVYRPAFAEEAVLSMMRAGQGSQFEPGLLALFFANFEQMHAVAELHPDLPHDLDFWHASAAPSVFDAIPSLLSAPVYQ
jgi:putative two-component system response regulator